jgi:hypothetical protein
MDSMSRAGLDFSLEKGKDNRWGSTLEFAEEDLMAITSLGNTS